MRGMSSPSETMTTLTGRPLTPLTTKRWSLNSLSWQMNVILRVLWMSLKLMTFCPNLLYFYSQLDMCVCSLASKLQALLRIRCDCHRERNLCLMHTLIDDAERRPSSSWRHCPLSRSFSMEEAGSRRARCTIGELIAWCPSGAHHNQVNLYTCQRAFRLFLTTFFTAELLNRWTCGMLTMKILFPWFERWYFVRGSSRYFADKGIVFATFSVLDT